MTEIDIKNLQTLINWRGWKVLKEIVNWKIEDIETVLLSSVDWKKNEQKYNEYDILRYRRNDLKELLEIPQEEIDAFKVVEAIEAENEKNVL